MKKETRFNVHVLQEPMLPTTTNRDESNQFTFKIFMNNTSSKRNDCNDHLNYMNHVIKIGVIEEKEEMCWRLLLTVLILLSGFQDHVYTFFESQGISLQKDIAMTCSSLVVTGLYLIVFLAIYEQMLSGWLACSVKILQTVAFGAMLPFMIRFDLHSVIINLPLSLFLAFGGFAIWYYLCIFGALNKFTSQLSIFLHLLGFCLYQLLTMRYVSSWGVTLVCFHGLMVAYTGYYLNFTCLYHLLRLKHASTASVRGLFSLIIYSWWICIFVSVANTTIWK